MIAFSQERLARIAEMERRHFWFVGRQTIMRRLWQLHVYGTCRVLDVGCGTGHTLRELASQGHWVVGIDGRREGLQILKQEGVTSAVAQAGAPHLPLRDQSFDVVLMQDVLEHTDDVALLAEAHRLLRPGGWLLLSVPALPWLWSYRDDAAGHLRRYTREHLRRRLVEAKYSILDMRYYQCCLLPMIALTRLLGRRGPGLRDQEDRPLGPLNRVFSIINRLEARFSDTIPWPLGSSLVAACRRP